MKTVIALAVAVVSLIAFYFAGLNHVGLTEIGLAYNTASGALVVQKEPGWYITAPWILVANVSTRPQLLQLPSDAKVINQKLVCFNPEGAQEFVLRQGFTWMMDSTKLDNILLGYAYSGKSWPFLTILEESGIDARTGK